MTSITGEANIARYRLVTLRGAVRLEQKGMKRSRGPSARAIVIRELGLPKAASYEYILDAIEKELQK